MQYRHLGKQGLKVSAIGYGCPTFQGKLSVSDQRRDMDGKGGLNSPCLLVLASRVSRTRRILRDNLPKHQAQPRMR